jgi:phosphate transport system protein
MDMGLERLRNLILDMATMSEKSVDRAVDIYKNGGVAREDIHKWSEQLLILQEEAGDLAVELLARYQPVAKDLRFVKSCLEISYGFSRFGRYAYDIVQVLDTFGDISECDDYAIIKMGAEVKTMMRMSIEAFKNMDVELAKRLSEKDDIVDALYADYVHSITENLKGNLKCSVSVALILRYLERIADHTCYIGDSVVYIVEGAKIGVG